MPNLRPSWQEQCLVRYPGPLWDLQERRAYVAQDEGECEAFMLHCEVSGGRGRLATSPAGGIIVSMAQRSDFRWYLHGKLKLGN